LWFARNGTPERRIVNHYFIGRVHPFFNNILTVLNFWFDFIIGDAVDFRLELHAKLVWSLAYLVAVVDGGVGLVALCAGCEPILGEVVREPGGAASAQESHFASRQLVDLDAAHLAKTDAQLAVEGRALRTDKDSIRYRNPQGLSLIYRAKGVSGQGCTSLPQSKHF